MQTALFENYEKQVWELSGIVPGSEGVRMRALKQAQKLGLPTKRDEEWRYSDIKFMQDTAFHVASKINAVEIDTAPLCDTYAGRLVFINGYFDEELSDYADLLEVANVRPLANHLITNPERVDELIEGGDGIALLNTALMVGGMVVSVPANTKIEKPLEILNFSTGTDQSANHTRHIFELGEKAALTIVENFVGDGLSGNYWNNSVVQARVSEGGNLEHHRVQNEGIHAFHTSKAYVSLDTEATYTCTNLMIGGKVARFEGHVKIMGEGARATIDGVALAGKDQSQDILTNVRHMVPGATSDQVVRTIADAFGKTAFQGKVIVDKDAQETEADQSFKALLFDRRGEANAKPELEILADDVKCSHGATVGELDEKAIFYLTSRGVDPVTARQILVSAFTADAFDRLEENLKDTLIAKVADWMAERNIG
ncbi:Fe-S cluster assembly protein SufD [Kordiimonas sp. SCSIO 12610]|uniref:Fe-S cluster assembly protein SufD n=1 Tax=Kordiimonas sp. SCSIO 12610 TaxID=2829597 RepID=UPI00210EAEBE|nr:Fe-S cluster assembly protein SufD [Kordiimonas sp. SCSIO 12610]UTW55307.1 Fe-S cluster assembly protein SufD [Kordiimonas sp. SCSIO 12610]